MDELDKYIQAGTRDNTRKAYRTAVEDFEVVFRGVLPTTAEGIARYLAQSAERLGVATLKQRLAGLAEWHKVQGFPDPTKDPLVRKVMRGIKALHAVPAKQAEPLQIEQLVQAADWLDAAVRQARDRNDRGAECRHLRDKSLLLLGFWRGFRGDELANLEAQFVQVEPGAGMVCLLPTSKTDRNHAGRTFRTPALSRLCPVDAYLDWVSTAQITRGPVYRAIDRWGHIGEDGLHIDSIVPILRSILGSAGIAAPELFTSHSLRRGFATWASSNGWDLKGLMEHVGWRDAKSALAYIEVGDPYAKRRIEAGLTQSLALHDAQRLADRSADQAGAGAGAGATPGDTSPRIASRPGQGLLQQDATGGAAGGVREKPVRRAPAPAKVWRLKIELVDLEPAIWRRFDVSPEITLSTLHHVLQIVMGWEDAHLYSFHDEGEYVELDKGTSLAQAARPGDALLYVYDFGDHWRHLITIEKEMSAAPRASCPRCIAGKHACPPEDCGGPAGYADLVQTLAGPRNGRRRDLVEWLGGTFDPKAFSVDTINRQLAREFLGNE